MTPLQRSKTSKWELTMSTSKSRETQGPKKGNSAALAEAWDASKALPPGLPDPAVLARMATEFFTAMPEFAQFSKNAPAAEAPPQSAPVTVESTTLPPNVT